MLSIELQSDKTRVMLGKHDDVRAQLELPALQLHTLAEQLAETTWQDSNNKFIGQLEQFIQPHLGKRRLTTAISLTDTWHRLLTNTRSLHPFKNHLTLLPSEQRPASLDQLCYDIVPAGNKQSPQRRLVIAKQSLIEQLSLILSPLPLAIRWITCPSQAMMLAATFKANYPQILLSATNSQLRLAAWQHARLISYQSQSLKDLSWLDAAHKQLDQHQRQHPTLATAKILITGAPTAQLAQNELPTNWRILTPPHSNDPAWTLCWGLLRGLSNAG